MKKSRINSGITKTIILVFILFIVLSSLNVYAEDGGNTGGGTSSDYTTCTDCEWIFDRVGVRLALYKYDGVNLHYYGYRDHCSTYEDLSCPKGSSVYQSTKIAGKVAHQQITEYIDTTREWANAKVTIDNTSKFPTIKDWDAVEAFTKEYFGLDTNDKDAILSKLKSEFIGASSLTISDLENIYITIEPTMRIVTKIDSVATYYYGSAYEFAQFFYGEKVSGLTEVIYYGLPEYMMSQTMTGDDKNGFIGKYVELISSSELTTNVWTVSRRKSNADLIISTKGYGINVFWLGGYVSDCTITQDSKTGNYNLNIIGNSSNISYGISNTSGTINNKLTYTAQSTDTNIYGTIKNSSGEIIATCSIPREPVSCTITQNTTTGIYNLNITGNNTGNTYGISNQSGITNNKLTYTAQNTDTNIYGTVKNSAGETVATCSINRTPASCVITTTDKKIYTLNLIGDIISLNYGISNVSGTVNNLTTYTALYNDTKIYGTIKDSNGNIVTTCDLAREEDTCPTTCANKEGNELLSCAEKFCTMSSSNTTEKRNCISTCGIDTPNFSSCSSPILKNGKDTECEDNTEASITTCTPSTTDNYYKTICQETSTIRYPKDLPTVLKPGMGFSYSPTLTGSKVCRIEFDTQKWIFDYITSYTSEERDALLEILNKYNDKSIIINNKDSFKYYSSDADIIMNITLENDESSIIKLFPYNTQNLLNEDVEIVNGAQDEIIVYVNGEEKKYNVYNLIQTTSSNQTMYKLEGVCKSKKDGTLYASIDNKCRDDDEILYEYITKEDMGPSEYATYVEITKTSSNLSVNNTCYYTIEKVENPPTNDNSIITILGIISVISISAISYKKLKLSTNK